MSVFFLKKNYQIILQNKKNVVLLQPHLKKM